MNGMLPLTRIGMRPLSSLLAILALATVVASGCSKTNDINAGPGGSGGSCDGQACAGRCVEGACRAYCDENYRCPGEEICTAVDEVPVCLPPGARVYPPYAPFDMLEECAASGCEIPLDAPRFEGVLRLCGSSYTDADIANPDFDYGSACAAPDAYEYRLLEGRRLYHVWANGSCRWAHAGAGAADTLIEYSCDYDYIDTLLTRAEFSRVVVRDGVTYVWTQASRLFVLSAGEQVEIPSSCHFDSTSALAKECELPTYPALGRSMGPESAGLWISCDTVDASAPEQCELDFNGPSPDGQRIAVYMDARGYGQVFGFEGGVSGARPSRCDAAFRVSRRRDDPTFGRGDHLQGYVLESEIPFGSVRLDSALFEEVLEVTEGPGTAPGKYIVGNSRSSYWYKQVPLPDDFVDPCADAAPNSTW